MGCTVLNYFRRYTKGVPFLLKMVYKRVRGWTSGQSLPVFNFVECPPGEIWIFSNSGNRIEKDIKAEERKKCHITYSYIFFCKTCPQLSPPPKSLTLDLAQ